MESTSVYWKPIVNLLEAEEIEFFVVNAQHIKAVPGRKTDVKDAEWIAKLLRHGLLNSSYIPDRNQRELRELVRYRRSIIEERARQQNRCKGDRLLWMTSMCFDLSVYDLFGVLASGGTVVIAQKEEVQDPIRLREMLRKERITFWDSVPTTLHHLIRSLEESGTSFLQEDLRVVFLSGDWIPVDLKGRSEAYLCTPPWCSEKKSGAIRG
ncbi:IS110 family transposase [Lysinibacillus sphaericus]